MANKYPDKFKAADLARRDTRLIHVALGEIKMDDDTYRALLNDRFKVDSSTKLDAAQRRQLLDHFKTLGFKPASSKSAGRPKIEGHAHAALLGKIEALLAVQGLPWAYLAASKRGPCMLKRLAGVDKIEWATAEGLRALITALAKRKESGK